MRTTFDRVADVAFVAVAAALGAVIALAALSERGLVLGGAACGGGGNAQRCTRIARQLSLVEISPRAWALVAGGVLCILLAAAALGLRPGPTSGSGSRSRCSHLASSVSSR